MDIEFTKRIVDRMAALKGKESKLQKLIDISEAINGGRTDNLTEPYRENAFESFRRWYAESHYEDFGTAFEAAMFFTENVALPVSIEPENVYSGKYSGLDFTDNYLKHGLYEKSMLEFGSVGLLDSPEMNIMSEKPKLNTFLITSPVPVHKLMYKGEIISEMNPYEASHYDAVKNGIKGNVVVIGDYLLYAALLSAGLMDEGTVSSVTIVEENKELAEYIKKNMVTAGISDSVKLVNEAPETFLKCHQEVNTLIIDRIVGHGDIYEYYRYSVLLESLVPNARTININDSLVLPPVQTLIFKYLSAKAGDKNYMNYFAQLSPEVYEFMEKDKTFIRTPLQLEYILDPKNFKKLI